MTNVLEIYRGGEIFASIDIDTGAVFSEKLPGTDMISCPVLTKDVIDLQEEDYIFHKGNPYKIRILPDFGKDSSTIAKSYKIDFLAKFYDLIDIYVEHEGAHVFPYYGNARLQLEMCLNAANLNGATWTIGDIEETEDLLLKYDWTFIRPALDQIAEAFGLEWKAEGTTISMVKSVGRDTGLVFEIGRGKGLHEITRSSDTSKEKLTRIYGVGGTTNIDSKYRKGKEPNLVFQERYVETPGAAAGTERVRMGKYENPDIYPRFEGTVTDVVYVTDSEGKITSCTITDPSIDFDVMAHMQEGVKGQVSFRTGPVTGIDFEMSAASLFNKTITLVPFTDATGYYYPSATSQPEVGNKFTIIKMRMPAAYTIKAENELKEKSTIFLNDNKLQRIIYNAKPDESHLRNNMIALRAGDRVTLKDYDFGINQVLRFTEISYPLVNEFNVTAVIGNEIRYDRVAKLFADVIQNKQQIAAVNLTNAEEARRNTKNLVQLKDLMIDPSGNYYTEKIKPGSIETLYFSTGAKANHFDLVGISFDANHLGNPNAFTATAGRLVHYDLKIEGAGFAWEMQPYSISTLVPNNQYWLYARISKTALVGSWVLSTEILLAESEPGYFTLQAGVLFPVVDGRRDHQLTKGMVFIIGDQITAGRMKSIDNRMFIDLTTGQLQLGDATNGLDWNVSTPNKLTIKGALLQSGSGIVATMPVYRGPYNPTVTYFDGDQVIYGGSTWKYVNAMPMAGQTPADNAYWDPLAIKGDQGNAGAPGATGPQGNQGTPGAAGTSNFFHVAYANSIDGSVGFNQVAGDYIGTYVDNNPTDSSNYQSYTWRLLKGVSAFTLVNRAGMNVIGNAVTKISTPGNWDASVKSLESFYNGAVVTFKIATALGGTSMMMGLNSDPDTNDSYDTIDYAIYLYTDGWVRAYENGISVFDGGGYLSYTADDLFSVQYDGNNITYLKNGAPFRISVAGANRTFSLDSSFVVGGAKNITFASAGADGIDGTNGIPGQNGANGQTSYLHLKYSDDGGSSFTANAGESPGKYLGQYVDFTLADSNNPASYTWALIQGSNGAQGSPGANGNYTEFIFQKNGSTTSPPSLDPNNPTPGGWSVAQPYTGIGEYLWMSSSIKSGVTGGLLNPWAYPARTTSRDGDNGSPGANGQNGQNGANGVGAFTLINKANMAISGSTATKVTANGNWDGGVRSLESFTNGAVVGFAAAVYGSYFMIALNGDPGAGVSYETLDYAIFLVSNNLVQVYESGAGYDTGLSYAPGDSFLIKYDGGYVIYYKNGSEFRRVSTSPNRIFYLDSSFVTTNTPVNNLTFAAVGSQGLQGPPGTHGNTGPQGQIGPAIANQGNYDGAKTYYGNTLRIDVVKYNGIYYFSRVDAGQFSGVVPTNGNYWNPVGAQFDSVATDLLLARAATIDNLTVRNILTADSGRRYAVSGPDNAQYFIDQFNNILNSTRDNVDTFTDDDGAGTQRPLAGTVYNKFYSSNPSNPDVVRITGNGIYSNTGFAQANTDNISQYSVYASIVGYIRRAISLAAGNFQAGVAGLANTANSVGGFFKHMGGGTALHIDGKIQTVSNNSTFVGKTGYISFDTQRVPGATGYTGIRVVNGLIVEYGNFNYNSQPPGLS